MPSSKQRMTRFRSHIYQKNEKSRQPVQIIDQRKHHSTLRSSEEQEEIRTLMKALDNNFDVNDCLAGMIS
jgi:hypothetical protein